ncbi:hypothetical protein HY357_04155 [Candidatus Roizmanbacteria bacterium]|nr:hypothetical protein [Candidatus Roizmanbacteria bacterium]
MTNEIVKRMIMSVESRKSPLVYPRHSLVILRDGVNTHENDLIANLKYKHQAILYKNGQAVFVTTDDFFALAYKEEYIRDYYDATKFPINFIEEALSEDAYRGKGITTVARRILHWAELHKSDRDRLIKPPFIKGPEIFTFLGWSQKVAELIYK